MHTKFYKNHDISFEAHPKYSGVQIAKLIAEKDGLIMGVCQLLIDKGIEIPIHTHDPQIDSIFVIDGMGEAFINGEWKVIERGDYIIVPAKVEHGVKNTGDVPLRLFIVHNPALF